MGIDECFYVPVFFIMHGNNNSKLKGEDYLSYCAVGYVKYSKYCR